MTVDDYINQQTTEHQRILRWIRPLILTAAPGINEKVNWSVPFYTYQKQPFCYLTVVRTKSIAVDLTFLRGVELPDEGGLLEGRGRKMVRSLVIHSLTEWEEDVVRTYLQEALLLNESRFVQQEAMDGSRA